MTRRAEISLLILSSFFITLVLLAWVFQEASLNILKNAPMVLEIENEKLPLPLGDFPLQVVFLSMAVLVLNMINDLFGRISAFTLSLAAGLSLLVFWGFFQLLSDIPLLNNGSTLKVIFNSIINLERTRIVALAVAVVVGFGCLSIIFDLFRKWTRSGFILLCLLMSYFLGFAVFATCFFYMTLLPTYLSGEMIAKSVTLFTQLFCFSFFLIPFYYIIRIPFRLFSGSTHYQSVKQRYSKKSLFKPVDKDFFESHQEKHEKKIEPEPIDVITDNGKT